MATRKVIVEQKSWLNISKEQKMASGQNQKITAKDLASRNKSPRVKAIYDLALKHAYEDQQKLLKQAKALQK